MFGRWKTTDFFGELSSGKRPQHRPKLRWRDCVSKDLQDFMIQPNWHVLAMSRTRWREVLSEGAKAVDESLNNKYKIRHACQMGLSSPSKSKCNIYAINSSQVTVTCVVTSHRNMAQTVCSPVHYFLFKNVSLVQSGDVHLHQNQKRALKFTQAASTNRLHVL